MGDHLVIACIVTNLQPVFQMKQSLGNNNKIYDRFDNVFLFRLYVFFFLFIRHLINLNNSLFYHYTSGEVPVVLRLK